MKMFMNTIVKLLGIDKMSTILIFRHIIRKRGKSRKNPKIRGLDIAVKHISCDKNGRD